MANTANKTQETDADVAAFIASLTDAGQRADSDALIALMSRVSGHPPRMWGPSIIGFGSYHYVYDSGREGDSLRIGFSPRKGKLALYGYASQLDAMDGLGKHSSAKACLYIKRLDDVDVTVLERVTAAAWASMAARYPA